MKGISKRRSGKFGRARVAAFLFALLLIGWAGFAYTDGISEGEDEYAEYPYEASAGEALDNEIEAETVESEGAPEVVEHEFEAESCSDCHGSGTEGAPIVTHDALGASVHEGFECEDCHEAVEIGLHEETPDTVDCSTCHDEETEVYVKHGRLMVGVDPDIPTCADCHGSHDILEHTNEESRVHPLNMPDTCGNCHEDYDLTREHKFLAKHPVETYRASVHGKATARGRYTAATCNDCHSTGGTAHRILSPGDLESTINHFTIPNTCGKCHEAIERDYWDGIHGQLSARGETESPVCTHCHGEHQIIEHADPRSRVSHAKVAEATCAPCHESASLNEKYGMPAGRLASFVDSYHGLKSKAGDKTVANCASCHGAHRILPHTDATSSIHPDNLQHTCGECHPGISEEFAQAKIHEIGVMHMSGWPDFFAALYMIVITCTLAGMLAYIGLDYRRQVRKVMVGQQVRRMTQWEVFQHSVLLIAFLLLVVTGFALRFSDAWWSLLLFGREGGFPLRSLIHRISAVVLVLLSVAHLLYLRGRRGREFIRHIFPTMEDLVELRQLLLYNLGKTHQRPNFGRFSFGEKFEYWALVWGMIIMTVTGSMLWFDNYVVQALPKGVLDVMLVIHYYEAWLATLSILIWHLYSTVFNPAIYPMNPSWITGTMPLEQYQHEHPGDGDPLAGEPEPERARPNGALSEPNRVLTVKHRA
jgi:formate dehydrogenase gamma subunit